jgi:tripartite-type tricarboxylate transporter receptor subunit TctC
MIATSTTLGINKTRYKNLAYDPLKAFAAIAPLAAIPFALIVNPSIPANALAGFIAKSNPGLAQAPPAMASRITWAPKC